MTRQNLDFYRNESVTFSGVLRDKDGIVDLTNAVMTWRLGDTDARQTRLTLTEGAGITVDDATAGEWTVTVDPADTDDLDPGYYIHQGAAVIGTTTHFFTQGRIHLRRDLD